MDSSFNNLSNKGSQAGQIIFINGAYNNSCPLYWNLSKIKRLTQSTIKTERLSLLHSCDVAIFISNFCLNYYIVQEKSH